MFFLRKYRSHIVFLSFIFFWVYLIRPALTGELGGTFKERQVPQEYVDLKDFIYNQKDFFRTFWIPQKQRFGFASNNHPAIDSLTFLKVASSTGIVDWLNKEESKKQLERLGVKYIIIPYDSERELFLEDRKYDDKERQKIRDEVNKINWLRRLDNFNQNTVFETPNHFDKFWLENKKSETENFKVAWKMVNPSEYHLSLENIKAPCLLIFSESFDQQWFVQFEGNKIYSQKTKDGLNSFSINQNGNLEVTVNYEPQKYFNYGLIISLATFIFLFGALIISHFKKKNIR